MADKTWAVSGNVRKMPNIGVTATADLYVILKGPGGVTEERTFPFTTNADGTYSFEFTESDTLTPTYVEVLNFAAPYTRYSGGLLGTVAGNSIGVTTCFVLQY